MLVQILRVSDVLCSLPFDTSSAVSYPFKYSLNKHLFVSHHAPNPVALRSFCCHLSPRLYCLPTNWHLPELTGCLQANPSCLQHVLSEELFLEQLTGHAVLRLNSSYYPPIQVQIAPLGFHVFLQPLSLLKLISPLFSPNSSLTGKISLILQGMVSSIIIEVLVLNARVMVSSRVTPGAPL